MMVIRFPYLCRTMAAVRTAEVYVKRATKTFSRWNRLKQNDTSGIKTASDVKRAINN